MTGIEKVHQKVRTTTVYVTHDQIEAMTLADRVVVMNHGVIEQVGTPHELYHNPKTRFAAGFIGTPAMNFIPCRMEGAGDGLVLRVGNKLTLPVPPGRAKQYAAHNGKGELLLGLRPEHLTEARTHMEPGKVLFDAKLDVTETMGMEPERCTERHWRPVPVCQVAASVAYLHSSAGSRARETLTIPIVPAFVVSRWPAT